MSSSCPLDREESLVMCRPVRWTVTGEERAKNARRTMIRTGAVDPWNFYCTVDPCGPLEFLLIRTGAVDPCGPLFSSNPWNFYCTKHGNSTTCLLHEARQLNNFYCTKHGNSAVEGEMFLLLQ